MEAGVGAEMEAVEETRSADLHGCHLRAEAEVEAQAGTEEKAEKDITPFTNILDKDVLS